MKIINKLFFTGALLSALFDQNSVANSIFEDNFDSENAGVEATGYSGFAQWTTLPGYADLLKSPQPEYGLSVNLTTHGPADPGFLFTDVHLTPGWYVFHIAIGGNGVDRSAMSLVGRRGSEVVVATGFGADPGDFFRSELLPFMIVTEGEYRFVATASGSAPLFDNVRITVPDDGMTFSLMGGGLACLLLLFSTRRNAAHPCFRWAQLPMKQIDV